MRAQLRTGNLLTGQLYIALDFFPNAPKATMDWNTHAARDADRAWRPAVLQDSVTSLLAKLNKIPFEGIGKDAQRR